ncbi:MAG TPA: phospholipase D-like domain-containing protein [Pseudomonadales bacterium]
MDSWTLVIVTAVSTLLLGGLVLFVLRQLAPREKEVHVRLEHLYGADDEQFVRTLGSLFTASCHPGNAVTALRNGDEIFPAMLTAIAGAQRTITFETFIYWSGEIGRRFTEALAERARAGVRVHVLLDWFGSMRMDEALLDALRDAGAEVERYHRPHPLRPHHTNHRTHRKLLVVDGRIGFTGGVGIADEWTGNAQDPAHWRDSHFRVEGPAVAALQGAFMDNWVKARGEVLHSDRYFPKLEPAGEQVCQVLQSSPEGGSDSVRLMFLLAITAASHSIRIGTAYFVPDTLATETLLAARRRGVRVQIIVPGQYNDEGLVRLVSRDRYGAFLAAGIEIYEYQPTMYHTKLMIVDEVWVSVGSTNFDNRSFRLNDEVNLNVYDPELARQQIAWFEDDLARSARIELDDWRRRPLGEKLKARAAAALSSQI